MHNNEPNEHHSLQEIAGHQQRGFCGATPAMTKKHFRERVGFL